VDLKLTPGRRFLIISGANAGGKTVALKTLGLLALMAQSGIPIPVAEGSEFCPFEAVFADIGYPQDLARFGTFSAHHKRALPCFAGQALILLDRLGTSSRPPGQAWPGPAQAFAERRCRQPPLPLLSFASAAGFENGVVFERTRPTTHRLHGVGPQRLRSP
jgi:hypothetical protein